MWTNTSSTTSTNSTSSPTYYVMCYTSTTSSTTTTMSTWSNVYATPRRAVPDYWAYSPRIWLEGERRRQAGILGRHKRLAKIRAEEILLENLTPEQRQTFEENDWFVVEGGKSGKRYRIEKIGSLAANIAVLRADNDNRVDHRLCGHCDLHEVPLGDHLLAQKIMLEHAEDEFIRLANRHAA